jgi:hypothetical protein
MASMKGDGQPLFAINIASPWGGRGGGGGVFKFMISQKPD